ncbi:MAG: cupin domain-containing protein [Bacteroidales bacterium]|nr:cupin domain-containing protein [Bacteroidales bacterium]
MTTAEKFNLSETVRYAGDSVVSKTITKKDSGTITLFAFDKNQGLSEHSAPFDAMVNVIDGKADVIIDGKSNILSQGESIIMPANVPHALKAIEKFKMLLVMIK